MFRLTQFWCEIGRIKVSGLYYVQRTPQWIIPTIIIQIRFIIRSQYLFYSVVFARKQYGLTPLAVFECWKGNKRSDTKQPFGRGRWREAFTRDNCPITLSPFVSKDNVCYTASLLAAKRAELFFLFDLTRVFIHIASDK